MGIKEPAGRDVFLYSNWHIGIATWLGGSLAGAVLIALNWLRVGKTLYALGSAAGGVALAACAFWAGSMLPDDTRANWQLVWAQVAILVGCAQKAGEQQRALVQPPDEVTCSSVPRVVLGVVVLPLGCAALIMVTALGTDQVGAMFAYMRTINRANNGDVEAQLMMADSMLEQKKYEAVLRWLDRPQAKESPKGLRLRAWLYERGLGVQTDAVRAVELYRKAAEKGDPWSCGQLGWLAETGTGMAKDMVEAGRCYRRAAELGDSRGQASYGQFLVEGLGGVARDEPAAIALFEKSAAQNDDSGQAWMGWCYENGVVRPKDPAEALSWYRKAAAQGNTFAPKRIAELEAAGKR